MELYKVVHKNRKSLMAEGKYCLEYHDGSIINTLPGTIGIMLFNDIDKAKFFADGNFFTKDDYTILKIEPLDSITVEKRICNFTDEYVLDEYYNTCVDECLYPDFIWVGDKFVEEICPPPGTVFCNSILVKGEYV